METVCNWDRVYWTLSNYLGRGSSLNNEEHGNGLSLGQGIRTLGTCLGGGSALEDGGRGDSLHRGQLEAQRAPPLLPIGYTNECISSI